MSVVQETQYDLAPTNLQSLLSATPGPLHALSLSLEYPPLNSAWRGAPEFPGFSLDDTS